MLQVTDFGLAHALPQGADSYTSTNVIGDCAYMAPEALLDNQVSAKMDTYSFALVVPPPLLSILALAYSHISSRLAVSLGSFAGNLLLPLVAVWLYGGCIADS